MGRKTKNTFRSSAPSAPSAQVRSEAVASLQKKQIDRDPLVLVKFRKSWKHFYSGRRTYGIPKSVAEKLLRAEVVYLVEDAEQ